MKKIKINSIEVKGDPSTLLNNFASLSVVDADFKKLMWEGFKKRYEQNNKWKYTFAMVITAKDVNGFSNMKIYESGYNHNNQLLLIDTIKVKLEILN